MRINYTSYDIRRGQDSLSSRKHSDIMTLARDENSGHPFDYHRVIGIFHADVVHLAPGATDEPTSLEFLWVRNLRRDPTHRAGFKAKRLHRLEFLPSLDPNAFGFINPDEVIRGSHLIPAFHYGPTDTLLPGESLAREPGEVDDWKYLYVGMYVVPLHPLANLLLIWYLTDLLTVTCICDMRGAALDITK